MRLRIGVLAIQGDFAAHLRMFESLEAEVIEVRTPADLENLDGLTIPGGESTTISKGMARDGLDTAIRDRFSEGLSLFGTCAGMILLDREHLGLGDWLAERNAFGRQKDSFECDLEVSGVGSEPMRAVFIRAPKIVERGEAVEVLAQFDGSPVAVRQGNLLASAFHAELTDDSRLHAMFMAIATGARDAEEAEA